MYYLFGSGESQGMYQLISSPDDVEDTGTGRAYRARSARMQPGKAGACRREDRRSAAAVDA